MTSIEMYHASIASLKARIDTLKSGGKYFFIKKLDGTMYEVRSASDLYFRWGTVIASSTGLVYLCAADKGNECWHASAGMRSRYANAALFEKLRVEAEQGITHSFLTQTGLWHE